MRKKSLNRMLVVVQVQAKVTLNMRETVMATKQETLLVIGESMLAQQFDNTKLTGKGCKKAMFQGMPSAFSFKSRKTHSVRVFDAFPIKDLIAIALEEEINRKLLLCILLRYTGMASYVSSNNLTEAGPQERQQKWQRSMKEDENERVWIAHGHVVISKFV